jgi:hypothetical protein
MKSNKLKVRIENEEIGARLDFNEKSFSYYTPGWFNDWEEYGPLPMYKRSLLYKSSDYIVLSHGSAIAILCNYGNVYKTEE